MIPVSSSVNPGIGAQLATAQETGVTSGGWIWRRLQHYNLLTEPSRWRFRQLANGFQTEEFASSSDAIALSMVVFIALFGWILVVFTLFAMLPPRCAMVASAIAGWLVLPPTGFDLPGLPTYDKTVAVTLSILLATAVFDLRRWFAFRPRWFDVPICVWCLAAFCSSISNDLGIYDGVAAVFRQMTSWLFPYLVGRLYITDFDSVRELAIGMIIGGVCLIPACLFEARMSPLLLPMVYGMRGYEGVRFGGYRPHVFFSTGLELGLWMNAVVLIAIWLWRAGQLKQLWGLPGGLVTAMLVITALVARSTGATVLLIFGLTRILDLLANQNEMGDVGAAVHRTGLLHAAHL